MVGLDVDQRRATWLQNIRRFCCGIDTRTDRLMVRLDPEDMRMENPPHSQSESAEYQIWLRAFLRALDGCYPDDAKEFAQRAVAIYQERWCDPIIDDRERLNESEWLITQRDDLDA